jgi:hypothetical protein
MFDKIVYIGETSCYVSLKEGAEIKSNILSSHVIVEDSEKQLLGEISELDQGRVNIKLIGEFSDGKLQNGILRKPLMDANIRPVNEQEIAVILGENSSSGLLLGKSPFYNGLPVYFNINDFYSNHFAIFGNSGSGKSCGVARLIQNTFASNNIRPTNANFIIFDVAGEYAQAFSQLSAINPAYKFRVFTTSESNTQYEPLKIPLWLLNEQDLALLLMSDAHSQLPIVERMLYLARCFAENSDVSLAFKNHIIAKAIIAVLFSDSSAVGKKNDIFNIVETCPTEQFNLETVIPGVGVTRKLRDCFKIDTLGNFTESVLFTQYAQSFVNEKFESYEPSEMTYFNLKDLEKALEFTLISEGWFKNPNTYSDAVSVKVRLHSLVTGPYAKIFDFPQKYGVNEYLSSLVFKGNERCQLVNINLDDMDDSIAAVITKILTRLIFDYAKNLEPRGSLPFHILVEEAHRYIRNDKDNFLIGYNIFDRVAKEGRKYGIILGVITQRPVELSDTVVSQCSNFLIFKTNHPLDEEYIRKMIPNINNDIVDKQKGLQSGTCLAFGTAFRIPVIVKLDMPNPPPLSSNADLLRYWGN